MNEIAIKIIKEFYKSLVDYQASNTREYAPNGSYSLCTEVKANRYKSWGKTEHVKKSLKFLLSNTYIMHYHLTGYNTFVICINPEKFIEYYENNLDPKPKTTNN